MAIRILYSTSTSSAAQRQITLNKAKVNPLMAIVKMHEAAQCLIKGEITEQERTTAS